MEGHAEVATKNGSSPTGAYLNGTLAYQLTDPRTAALFAPLWDAATGNWTVLPNAKVWFNENALTQGVNGSVIPSTPADASFGSLTVGYGCGADPNLIGPELGFGFGLTSALPAGEKFLIMKTAWGGKSLAGDYRPPTSVANPDPFCQGEACPNVVGHYYQVMVDDAHKMLAPGAIAQMFPDLAGLTPVLAGFGWFQGYNDGCDLNMTVRVPRCDPPEPFRRAAPRLNKRPLARLAKPNLEPGPPPPHGAARRRPRHAQPFLTVAPPFTAKRRRPPTSRTSSTLSRTCAPSSGCQTSPFRPASPALTASTAPRARATRSSPPRGSTRRRPTRSAPSACPSTTAAAGSTWRSASSRPPMRRATRSSAATSSQWRRGSSGATRSSALTAHRAITTGTMFVSLAECSPARQPASPPDIE